MPTTEHRGGIAMGSLIKQRAADTAGAPALLQALKKRCWFSSSFELAEGFKQGLSGCQSDLWARAARGSSRVLIGVVWEQTQRTECKAVSMPFYHAQPAKLL